MSDALGKTLMLDHARLVELRSGYDQFMADIREFVRPATSDFYNTGSIQNPQTNIRCYDSTALWAADQLAAGYAGFLVPSNDRWADIILEDGSIPSRDEQAWLDIVSDLMFREWSNPHGRFISAMQEDFYDLSGFGSSIIYQDYDFENNCVSFRSFSMANCWFRENNRGLIDTVHRSTIYTTRQLYQEFDHNVLDGIEQVFKDKVNSVRTWEVIHIVAPATDELTKSMKVKKKYISAYVIRQTSDTIRQGGYSYFPYHIGREKVIAGHVYGQSSAFTMLPAIKMLNAMMRSVIKAANKSVDPPVMAPSDGFIVPLKSDPGAVWWYDAAMMNPDAVKAFDHRGNFQISDTLVQDIRSQITRGFHVDWLIRNKKNERQTATEIMDDRDEMLRQLSPTLGKVEVEKIAPLVKTTYLLLRNANRIPPSPQSLLRKNLGIRFQSPVARAQYGARGADVQRYIQDLAPLINIWPSMIDTLNPDAVSEFLAKVRNVPISLLYDEETKNEIRDNKAQIEQENRMAAGAPMIGKAMKDVASAQEIMNG